MHLGVHINSEFRKLGIYSSFLGHTSCLCTATVSKIPSSYLATLLLFPCGLIHGHEKNSLKIIMYESLLLSHHKKIDQWQHTQVYPPFSIKTSTHSFICVFVYSLNCFYLYVSITSCYIEFSSCTFIFLLLLCEYSVLALRSSCRWVNLWRLVIVVAQFVCCYVCLLLSNPCMQPNVSVTYFIIDSNQHQRQTRPRQMAALCLLALFVWEALSSTC